MLLSDWYLARQEKRIQTAVEEAEAKAKAEGLEQGRAEVYQQIAEWNERRKAAEARGEPSQSHPPVCHKMVRKDKDSNEKTIWGLGDPTPTIRLST